MDARFINPFAIFHAFDTLNLASFPLFDVGFSVFKQALGKTPQTEIVQKSKKGSKWEVMSLNFQTIQSSFSINVEPAKGEWFLGILPKISIYQQPHLSLQVIKADYESAGIDDFELFWDNKPMNTMRKAGLLVV